MKAESIFTADEIAAAQQYGATVQRLRWNRTCLTFPSQEAYEEWLNEQKVRHPQRWEGSFSLLQAAAHS